MKLLPDKMLLGIFVYSLISQSVLAAADTTFADSQRAAYDASIASTDVPLAYKIGNIVQLKGNLHGEKSLFEIRGYGPNGELILNNTREYSTRITVLQSDVFLPVDQANGFSVGDRIHTDYSGNVRIKFLYPDGTVIAEGVDRGVGGQPDGSFWRMNPNEYTAAPSIIDRLGNMFKLSGQNTNRINKDGSLVSRKSTGTAPGDASACVDAF